MEQLCKLLSFDVFELLADLFGGPESSPENPKYSSGPVEAPSYTIRHNYPKRLVTYDAEEKCEPRLIRILDLSKSSLKPVCKNQQKQKQKKNEKETCATKCESSDKQTESKAKSTNQLSPRDKCTETRLVELDRCRKTLHDVAAEPQSTSCKQTTNGTTASLEPIQKFCFYWQTLTGHELRPTPYENFKQIFSKHYLKKCPQTSAQQLHTLGRDTWHCMNSEERVPFNLHALLYHISTGAVDPFDHCAVRVILNRWR